MTNETKNQIQAAQTTEEKVKAVNKILKDGEPNNVSVDSYANYSGYKPQFIFDAMNAVFGIGGWGFEELASDIINQTTDKGEINLSVCQVKVWLKDITTFPVGWGQGRITRGDVGDARKSAQTDAIKKALSYFSIGNRAYHGLLNGR